METHAGPGETRLNHSRGGGTAATTLLFGGSTPPMHPHTQPGAGHGTAVNPKAVFF